MVVRERFPPQARSRYTDRAAHHGLRAGASVDRRRIELDVFDYGNFRKYLEDWFAAARRVDRRISHRWFAQRLHSSNPSVLLNILRGRRPLPADRIDEFAAVLGLDAAEAAYFAALVAFAQAESPDARSAAFARVAELRTRRRAAEIPAGAYEFLGSWWIPAVFEMTRFAGFQEDPEWIAPRVDPPITAAQAARAIEVCEQLGLLIRVDGRLVASEPTIRTPELLLELASWPLHRDALDNASRGLQRLYADTTLQTESAFVACTVAVPAERIGELRTLLFEVQHRINGLAEGWYGEDPDRVVHVTMTLVPVARAEQEEP